MHVHECKRLLVCREVFQRHSVVYSNLPGPAEPLFFKGSRVLDVQLVVNNVLPQVSAGSASHGV